MRTVVASCVAGLVVLVSRAAGGPYVDPQHGFGLTPPEQWVRVAPGPAVVAFASPAGPEPSASPRRRETNDEFVRRVRAAIGAQSNVDPASRQVLSVSVAPAQGLTLQEVARRSRSEVARTRGMRVLGEVSATLAGEPAVRRTTRFTLPGRTSVETTDIICVRAGRVITVSFTAPTRNARRAAPLLTRVLASFTWKAPAPIR